MKKLFYAFLIVAAAATVFSCSKIEKQEPVAGEVHTVIFNAASPITKTTFGALSVDHFPTYWTTNDSEVKIAQNFSTGVAGTVTKTSDTKATLSAEFEDDASGNYTFYAISPASAVVSGVNSTYFSWNLEIPTTQTPTATGPDESAMIMAATSSTTVGSFPANANLSFSHVTAYVKMSITNLDLALGDEVASVLVSADANIAYRYYYYVSGAKVGTLEENSGQNAITIITDSPDDIWFACAPMANNTELTISVTSANSKVYTKVIHTPAALAAGHVASFDVDFTGIVPPSDKIYNLVTSYADLTAGSEVIIAAVGEDFAAGIGTTSSNYISAVSQAKSSGDTKIINPASTVDVFTVEAGGTANTIALHGTNGYLYAKSPTANNMGVQTTNNADGYWTPTIVDATTGEMELVATGSSNNNHMHYNGGSSRFSCYAATSSVTALQALYKLEGSGSGSALVTSYTITYDGNGSTAGTVPAAVEVTGPFIVSAVGDLEKSGYNFTGWNTASDGSGTPYAAGAEVTPTADMVLYAQWTLAGATKYYELVTDLSALSAGDKVLIINTVSQGALPAFTSTSTISPTSLSAKYDDTNDRFPTNDATVDACAITLVSPTTAISGKVVFKLKMSNDYFLVKTGTSGTGFNPATSSTAESGDWTLTMDAEGRIEVKHNLSSATRGLVWRTGTTNKFGAYALSNVNDTEYYNVYFYKLAD